MKTCSKCKNEKDFSSFARLKSSKKGYRSQCKMCVKEYNKDYYSNNTENSKQYYINNKEHIKQNQSKYQLENKEYIRNYNKQYQINNKNVINKYQRDRKLNDPLFKLMSNIRTLIYKVVKRQRYKNTSKTCEILGCSFEEFKIHLENQFTDGMNWENAGKWHIDHIYPVSRATDEQHLIKLNHYTNLQPLWAKDNIKKSNKI